MTTNENGQGIVRCIGRPNEEVKVYLEEKSDLFLKENMTNRVGRFQLYYLLGREYRLGRQTVYLIRGILEGESGSSRQIHFTEEQLSSLQRRRQRQYPSYQVVGWALNQPGYGNDGAWRFAKENEEFFAQSPILMMGDGLDGSLAFYQWSEGNYHELGGYYVYSDQNPADFRGGQFSENSMSAGISSRREEENKEEGPLPWELPVEASKRPFLSYLLKEKKTPAPAAASRASEPAEKKKYQESSPLRVLTSISAVLLMITLVMGMLLFNSVSTLDGIQSRLEAMDLQMEQMHKTMAGVESTLAGSEASTPDQGGDAEQQSGE